MGLPSGCVFCQTSASKSTIIIWTVQLCREEQLIRLVSFSRLESTSLRKATDTRETRCWSAIPWPCIQRPKFLFRWPMCQSKNDYPSLGRKLTRHSCRYHKKQRIHMLLLSSRSTQTNSAELRVNLSKVHELASRQGSVTTVEQLQKSKQCCGVDDLKFAHVHV